MHGFRNSEPINGHFESSPYDLYTQFTRFVLVISICTGLEIVSQLMDILKAPHMICILNLLDLYWSLVYTLYARV